MKFIETHCHLDSLKNIELSQITNDSKDIGLDKIITISVEPDNLQKVIDLSNSHEMIYCTQGIHPHDANKCSDEVIQIVKNNLEHNKVVAVGEIGLDFYYDFSDRKTQAKVFEEHLQIAIDFNYPVVIHSRDADSETISILKNFTTQGLRGVIHSFTGSKDLSRFAIDNNLYIGINGIITFKKSDALRDIIKDVPIENLLLETDSPYLAPTPFRGKENNPLLLPHIFEYYFTNFNHKKEKDELAEIFYNNSIKLFSF